MFEYVRGLFGGLKTTAIFRVPGLVMFLLFEVVTSYLTMKEE